MRRRAALCVVLGLAAAGCGGSETVTSGPAELLAAAVANAEREPSYASGVAIEMDVDGTQFQMDGTVRSSADNQNGVATFDYTEDGETFAFDMLTVDGVTYLRSDVYRLPRGKTWVRGGEETQEPLSTAQLVELLRESPEVEEAGGETIGGTPTVHLRGPIDVEEMLERVQPGPSTRFQQQSPEAIARLNAEADVWISEDDERIVRMAFEITFDGQPGHIRMTADDIEYGVSLDDVEAPPEQRVIDEAAILD